MRTSAKNPAEVGAVRAISPADWWLAAKAFAPAFRAHVWQPACMLRFFASPQANERQKAWTKRTQTTKDHSARCLRTSGWSGSPNNCRMANGRRATAGITVLPKPRVGHCRKPFSTASHAGCWVTSTPRRRPLPPSSRQYCWRPSGSRARRDANLEKICAGY